MNERFDPYRKWLGIPPEDQPPHHYRLLGVEPLEQDPDVIANAADGRMAQIKNFQIGKYSQLSQQILNEIATAKLCLLSPEKKKLYDRKLRPRLEAEKKGIPKAAPPAVRKPKPKTETTVAAEIPSIETSSVFSYVSERSPKRRSWPIPVALGVGAVTLVALSILFFGRDNGRPVAQQPGSPQALPEDLPPNSLPVNPPSNSDLPEEPPVFPNTSQPQQPVNPPADLGLTHPGTGPGRTLADLLDPLDPSQPGNLPPDPETPSPPQPPNDAAAVPKRLPLPDDDARRDARQRIGEIFKNEIAAATTPDKKAKLAQKLAGQAEETKDDSTARFVLLQLACEQAAEAGAPTVTLDLADQLGQLYDANVLKFKSSLLDKLAAAVQANSATSATNKHIVNTAVLLADEAVAADGLNLAGRFMRQALSAARNMKDPGLLRRLTARGREIDRLKLRFIPVRKALDVLAENPDDGEANLTAGQWYCFAAGNCAKGLPMLAKASDTDLAELAKQDTANPEDAKQQMKVADLWWDLAKKERGPQQRGIEARARHWYELALGGLTGLDQAKVEGRLAEMMAGADPAEIEKRGVVQKGNVALASNGSTVTGEILLGPQLIDGKTQTVLDPGVQAFGYGIWPCEWVITFDKVYRLREIRLKLHDKQRCYYNYTIAASADGENFTTVADRSRGQWSSWQQITFPARPVKQIRFKAIHQSLSKYFAVIEFEAYCIPPATPPR